MTVVRPGCLEVVVSAASQHVDRTCAVPPPSQRQHAALDVLLQLLVRTDDTAGSAPEEAVGVPSAPSVVSAPHPATASPAPDGEPRFDLHQNAEACTAVMTVLRAVIQARGGSAGGEAQLQSHPGADWIADLWSEEGRLGRALLGRLRQVGHQALQRVRGAQAKPLLPSELVALRALACAAGTDTTAPDAFSDALTVDGFESLLSMARELQGAGMHAHGPGNTSPPRLRAHDAALQPRTTPGSGVVALDDDLDVGAAGGLRSGEFSPAPSPRGAHAQGSGAQSVLHPRAACAVLLRCLCAADATNAARVAAAWVCEQSTDSAPGGSSSRRHERGVRQIGSDVGGASTNFPSDLEWCRASVHAAVTSALCALCCCANTSVVEGVLDAVLSVLESPIFGLLSTSRAEGVAGAGARDVVPVDPILTAGALLRLCMAVELRQPRGHRASRGAKGTRLPPIVAPHLVERLAALVSAQALVPTQGKSCTVEGDVVRAFVALMGSAGVTLDGAMAHRGGELCLALLAHPDYGMRVLGSRLVGRLLSLWSDARAVLADAAALAGVDGATGDAGKADNGQGGSPSGDGAEETGILLLGACCGCGSGGGVCCGCVVVGVHGRRVRPERSCIEGHVPSYPPCWTTWCSCSPAPGVSVIHHPPSNSRGSGHV